MKITSRSLVLLFFVVTLAGFQMWASEASAQSSYFTSRGCVDCHAAPTVATCAGCHQHSGTLAATTNKTTSYAPNETVTVTLTSSGARSGWIGARLYNQAGSFIASSTGNQSGQGGSAVYPAVLSAPAPATAGTYTWKIAYFGNNNGTGTGDVHSEKSVNVSFTVASAADTTVPVVTFTLPATATSLTVPATFSATDNVGVTGYLINKSATAPTTGWLTSAPASVTAVAGSNTFYAWARDAAGNVSLVKSASVTVTLPDTTVPVVSFTLPATATSLTVPATFSATDNVGVTGYLINKSATAPTTGWLASAPASVTAVAGSNIFYAWARDAAGNVSLVKSASVTVTIPPPADTTLPVVSFTLPATATSLTVPATFSATDNVGVTGYLITTSATAPTTGWLASAPASVTAVAGSNTFYAWARDAAGNVSLGKSDSVTVTIPPPDDTSVPVISTFTLPATVTSLTVPVTTFTATDNVGVTGYLINKSATAPTSGWLVSAPTSVTAVAGSNTFYAWARDAAGNVSASVSATVIAATVTVPPSKAGVFRDGLWYLDANGNRTWGSGDASHSFGATGDIPINGDWTGNGVTKIGAFNNGYWWVDTNGNGIREDGIDQYFKFGGPGDIPVTGDWNGDGITQVGVFRGNGLWYIDANGSRAWDAGDVVFTFGSAGDIPVTGDWDGNGITKAGVFRGNGLWYLDANNSRAWDANDTVFTFGSAGDIPVTGDWDGNGITKAGVFRGNGLWYIDANNSRAWDAVDATFIFGSTGDIPVTGKW